MTANDLLKWFLLLQKEGYNLNDVPLLFVEDNKGVPMIPKYVTLVKNVKKFNEDEDIALQTQFDQALLIGPILEVDGD